jgi:hypothetical protein
LGVNGIAVDYGHDFDTTTKASIVNFIRHLILIFSILSLDRYARFDTDSMLMTDYSRRNAFSEARAWLQGDDNPSTQPLIAPRNNHRYRYACTTSVSPHRESLSLSNPLHSGRPSTFENWKCFSQLPPYTDPFPQAPRRTHSTETVPHLVSHTLGQSPRPYCSTSHSPPVSQIPRNPTTYSNARRAEPTTYVSPTSTSLS